MGFFSDLEKSIKKIPVIGDVYDITEPINPINTAFEIGKRGERAIGKLVKGKKKKRKTRGLKVVRAKPVKRAVKKRSLIAFIIHYHVQHYQSLVYLQRVALIYIHIHGP